MSQQYVIGQEAISAFGQLFAQLSPATTCVVRGQGSYQACGAQAALSAIFANNGAQVVEFTGFSPNPKYDEVLAAVSFIRQHDARCIVAVGGGSAMDVAKLARHLLAEDHFEATLIALPTTSGTGAEATHFSVVYKEGVKHSFEADDILPDYAFVYPPFTYNSSAYLTACTGMDALAQAFESYWNRHATDESRAIALRAIDLLWTNLPLVVKSPTPQVRDLVAEGSYWAGRAINITKTTAPHAFSYAFTSHCGYPHGHAVALTFPFFFQLNLRTDDPVIARVGLNPSQSLAAQLTAYVQDLGLTFKGCPGAQLSDLLAMVNLQRLQNNPVQVDAAVIGQLQQYLESIETK